MTVFNTEDVDEPTHPMGWHDNVENVDDLIENILTTEEEVCDSCAV